MKNHNTETQKGWRRLFLATIGTAALAVPVVAGARKTHWAKAPAGQSQAGINNQPAFEAASIKPNKSGDTRIGGYGLQPGGRLTETNVPLERLILAAYQLGSNRLIAGPEWDHLLSERFDIQAKAEGNPKPEQAPLLLQSLLADRFRLLVHHETRQLPVYALVLSKPGKTGPQLKPHSEDTKCLDPEAGPPPPGTPLMAICGGFAVSGQLPAMREAGNKVTMDMLAGALSAFTDRQVVDHTGLTGAFDVTLEFAAALQRGNDPLANSSAVPTDPSGPPSIFTAVQEQLGLKLESQTGSVDVLVIDHLEEPTPN